MPLFLAIDGGQSSTVVLIGDETGRVVGWAKGGPCNHVSGAEAVAKFTLVLNTAIAQACTRAGIDLSRERFACACCGLSGGPADKAALLSQMIPTDHLLVKNDAEIALFGATGGRPGIVVIAGTGSISLGRNQSGHILRAGGWGYVFGDEGSAFDIARQAVRAALRAEEGWGGQTALLPALLAQTGAPNANHMLHLFYTPDWTRSRVAALSELVDEISAGGDVIARSILEQAGQSLASLAGVLRSQLFADGTSSDVAYTGGVFRSQPVIERFKLIVEMADGCRCIKPRMLPAAGALMEAYESAGMHVTPWNVPELK